MQDLQLVGFTTDRRGLIFRAPGSARAESFVVPLTHELVGLIAELADETTTERADDPSAAVGTVREDDPPTSRPASQLSVRDIQARLRAGEEPARIAAEAAVEEDWIERFAPPVRAEQRRIIDRALAAHLHRSRSGASAVPLRRAVGMAMADKGIAFTVAAFEASWSSRLLGHDRWLVEFTYRHRGRARTVAWDFDAESGELTTSDRAASQLGYVAPDEGRDDDAGAAVDGVVGARDATPIRPPSDASATSQKGTTSSAATTEQPTKRKAATKKRVAKKKPAPKKKAPTRKKPAPKKKAATKKAAAEKAATKKKAPATKASAPAEEASPAREQPGREGAAVETVPTAAPGHRPAAVPAASGVSTNGAGPRRTPSAPAGLGPEDGRPVVRTRGAAADRSPTASNEPAGGPATSASATPDAPATPDDPSEARRARAAARSAPTVQFRSGSAAPVRPAGASSTSPRPSDPKAPAAPAPASAPPPRPSSRGAGAAGGDDGPTPPVDANGAARPRSRRRRQLRAR